MEEHKHEFKPNEKVINKLLQLPCPQCGSELSYSAEKQQIACGFCGHTQDYSKSNDLVREVSLQEGRRKARNFQPKSLNKKVMECQTCRSQLMVEQDDVSIRCNFCGSEKVNETAFDKNVIQPQGIIPFKITKKEATEKFRVWIREGWFRPNKLKVLAQLGDVHGIYVPFWTFDADTYSEWSGEAGYYYYETETYYENGERKTRQVRKVRWKFRSGSFERFFNDILIVASDSLPSEVITGIYPYDLKNTVNFDPQLMVGWEAQIYNVDMEQGYNRADSIMDSRIRQQAKSELGGDTQRGLRVQSSKYDQTFKHIILPVWLCAYKYNDKVYRFAVNGQTGIINGEKPYSWVKIFFFVLFILAIIAVVVFVANENS